MQKLTFRNYKRPEQNKYIIFLIAEKKLFIGNAYGIGEMTEFDI